LTFGSIIGYAVIYTGWLKRATPQNIVIGGAAGAAPPVLGWVAVTHSVDMQALVLFIIIFTWTPPHFWALAITRRGEYLALALQRGVRLDLPMRTFRFSITYLMALFGAFIADHYYGLL
jgi:heme O synthase-like polyprenyltransferase